MNRETTLKKLYGLSQRKSDQIQKYIIDLYTKQISPAANPTVVILGAQPGAGKTEMEKEAQLELRNDVVVCNADLLRDFHPQAETIKKKHEALYPELTADYAQSWNNGLRNYCEANKLNYILETTFSSGAQMNKTILDLKQKGYHVTIKLLAVHPKLSTLGTHVRFEEMKLKEGAARLVTKDAHNQRFLKIPETLTAVESAHLYDDLHIYARNIVIGHNSLTEGIQLVALNPAYPTKVFREEIERKWPDKLKAYFDKSLNEVMSLKHLRGANQEEIKTFKDQLDAEIKVKWPKQLSKTPTIEQVQELKPDPPQQSRGISR